MTAAPAAGDHARLLRELSGLRRRGIRPGLGPTREALARLGDPQLACAAVHVAGTNGKGSTAAMIDACLRASGVRTGLFTSPHLCRFSERIRVDGAEIAPADLVRLAARARAAGPDLTFFELATCAALLQFAERGVQVAVVEAGIGGRLDATNVVTPRACAITRIGLDHMALLGPDLAAIAREKAGIVKPGAPVACAAQSPEALAPIEEAARGAGVPLRVAGRDLALWDGALALAGAHQRENAALAAAVAAELGAGPEAIARGLAEVRWLARLEVVARDPEVVLDCAHNPQAAAALAAALPGPAAVVFGALADKDAAGMIAALARVARAWVFCPVRSDRGRDPAGLPAVAGEGEVARDLPSALARARALAGPAGRVLVTGSTYLAGEARALVCGEPVDPVDLSDPAAAAARL